MFAVESTTNSGLTKNLPPAPAFVAPLKMRRSLCVLIVILQHLHIFATASGTDARPGEGMLRGWEVQAGRSGDLSPPGTYGSNSLSSNGQNSTRQEEPAQNAIAQVRTRQP